MDGLSLVPKPGNAARTVSNTRSSAHQFTFSDAGHGVTVYILDT